MAGKGTDKGKMTVGEAGRRGGEKTASTHGSEFYSEIGQKGGEKGGKKVQEEVRRYEEMRGKEK